jgi:hypothetical protein
MPSWSDRPYRRSSISQLESLFRGAKGDTEALRTLDNELGHRTTERASRLRSMVAEGLAALRVKPGVSRSDNGRAPKWDTALHPS